MKIHDRIMGIESEKDKRDDEVTMSNHSLVNL